MSRIALFSVAVALTVACTPQVSQRDVTASTPGIPELAAGNNAFAFDIEHAVAADGGNAFFSPFSMSGALAMTYAGAANETAAQMHDALHVGLPDQEFHPLFGNLMADLSSGRAPYELDIANRLYGQADYDWSSDFLALTDADYHAPMEPIDFHADADGARQEINGWVSDQTSGRIEDLFAPGTIGSDTAMVLVNAIYFKGQWVNGFDPKDTSDRPFSRLSGDSVNAAMMFQGEVTLPYAHLDAGGGAQIVEMPYKGGDLAMDVLVPDDVAGLPALEADLDGASFQAAVDAMQDTELNLTLPKVELTYARTLNADLQGLGMVDAFDPEKADFSAMNPTDLGLHVDLVVHKAFVSVDESGTEAAAATGVVMTDGAVLIGTEVVADHPYLFAIRDTLTGSVLFVGRNEDPAAK